MLQDIIVIDDFFKDPDSIIEFANQQVFEENDFEKTKSYWQGLRTKELHSIDIHRTNKITNEFFNRIFINEYKLTYKWKSTFYFHRLGSSEKFNYKWIHIDDINCMYAGVVYLNKNFSPDTGTFIIKNDKIIPIENKYNRLVLYKSNYFHSPMNGFGEGENSRLTLTMFINAISIELGMTNDKT
jgi:hypothetical protein